MNGSLAFHQRRLSTLNGRRREMDGREELCRNAQSQTILPTALRGKETKDNESWKVRRKTVKYHDLDMM